MRPLRLVAALMATATAGCAAVSIVLAPIPATLATGAPGSVYHPVGNAICRMFNLESAGMPIPCVAVSSEGSVANIQRITAGTSTFGLSQTDIAYAAFHGQGPFADAGPGRKLRMLVALYPEAFTVIARAETGIRDFQDLDNRRIGLGMSGAGNTFTRDVVLGFYGRTVSASARVLELGPAEQNRALCGGEVDAIIFAAGHPDGLTQEATTGCEARLVRVAGPPIDRLLASHPYYVPFIIPGGMYRGNPDGTHTFGTQAALVASADLPDRLAYAVVKAVFENFADFRRLHPALATLDPEHMIPSEAVMPIHPGAVAYFRDSGMMR